MTTRGVQGLLNEGCTLILCSDASRQLKDVGNPSDAPVGVLMRTMTVLKDRVREAEFQDIKGRLDSRSLEGLFYIHTGKELESKQLDWINCQDPSQPSANQASCTSYGIARDLQAKIATLRTDLDSFSEVEANALMASGYMMARKELENLQILHEQDCKPGTWGGFDIHAPKGTWELLKLEDLLGQGPQQASRRRNDLLLQLDIGKQQFFKAWQLIPQLKWGGIALLFLLIFGLVELITSQWQTTLFSISVGEWVIAMVLMLAAFFWPALKWLNPKEEGQNIFIKAAIALTGYVLAKVHLNLINRLFLRRGELKRLLDLRN